MEFFNKASKKFAQVQKKTGDSITAYKLQGQIKNIQADICQLYTEIGEACYKAHKAGAPAEGLADKFAAISTFEDTIAQLSAEIDRLNNIMRCPGCASTVEYGVRFCPNCGSRMPEPPVPQVECCPECGTERDGDARFCENCGHCFVAAVPQEAPVEEDELEEAEADEDYEDYEEIPAADTEPAEYTEPE